MKFYVEQGTQIRLTLGEIAQLHFQYMSNSS